MQKMTTHSSACVVLVIYFPKYTGAHIISVLKKTDACHVALWLYLSVHMMYKKNMNIEEIKRLLVDYIPSSIKSLPF